MYLSLRPLWLAHILLPTFVAGRASFRPSGGGSHNDSGTSGNGLMLEPIVAAIFAFAIIFFFATFIQLMFLIYFLVKSRKYQLPITANLGQLFPTTLSLSITALTLAYVLHAAFWAMTRNLNELNVVVPTLAFFNVWNALEFLTDIFLLSALFALLSHRERNLLKSYSMGRKIKTVVDMLLIFLLVGSSTGYLVVRTVANPALMAEAENIYVAFISFLMVATIYLAASSAMAHVHAQRNSTKDQIISRIAFVVSPCFFIHVVYLVIAEAIQLDGTLSRLTPAVDLAGLLIGGIAELVALTVCLRFLLVKEKQPESEVTGSYAFTGGRL